MTIGEAAMRHDVLLLFYMSVSLQAMSVVPFGSHWVFLSLFNCLKVLTIYSVGQLLSKF